MQRNQPKTRADAHRRLDTRLKSSIPHFFRHRSMMPIRRMSPNLFFFASFQSRTSLFPHSRTSERPSPTRASPSRGLGAECTKSDLPNPGCRWLCGAG